MYRRWSRKFIAFPMFAILALLLVFPISSAFAQEIQPLAAIGGSIQQGSWYEQWDQSGTAYCPNNRQRFITTTSEPFTLSAPFGEETLSVAYNTSRITINLARTSYGTYVYTSQNNWFVHLLEVTLLSPTQMVVNATFYAKDGNCRLNNRAVWSFSGVIQPPPTLPPQPPPPSQGCTVRPLSLIVNKRLGPGTNYPIVGKFQPGMTATVSAAGYDNQGARWWMLTDNTWVISTYTVAQGNCPQ